MALSPGTSQPSSCESDRGTKLCSQFPSTSTNKQNAGQSPALACSVPSQHEASSPTDGLVTHDDADDIVLFTTAMANQAAIDIEMRRFDNIFDWHVNYQRQKENRAPQQKETTGQKSSSPKIKKPNIYVEEKTLGICDAGQECIDRNSKKDSLKRRAVRLITQKKGISALIDDNDNDFVTQPKKTMTDATISNPLRMMEMMAQATSFQSSSISEVVDGPSTSKRPEQSEKLENINGNDKSVEQDASWTGEVQKMNMERFRQQQIQQHQHLMMSRGIPHPAMHPLTSPYPPGHPMMMGPGGPMPAHSGSPFPPGTGGMPLQSLSAGRFPSPYPPFGAQYPPGLPMGVANMRPMMFPGGMVPGHSPHFGIPAHMMAMQQQMANENKKKKGSAKSPACSRPNSARPASVAPMASPAMGGPYSLPPAAFPSPHFPGGPQVHPMHSKTVGPISSPYGPHPDAMSAGYYPGGMMSPHPGTHFAKYFVNTGGQHYWHSMLMVQPRAGESDNCTWPSQFVNPNPFPNMMGQSGAGAPTGQKGSALMADHMTGPLSHQGPGSVGSMGMLSNQGPGSVGSLGLQSQQGPGSVGLQSHGVSTYSPRNGGTLGQQSCSQSQEPMQMMSL